MSDVVLDRGDETVVPPAHYPLGEAPIAGFARVPPGVTVWIPVSLLLLFSVFLTGSWAKGGSQRALRPARGAGARTE